MNTSFPVHHVPLIPAAHPLIKQLPYDSNKQLEIGSQPVCAGKRGEFTLQGHGLAFNA